MVGCEPDRDGDGLERQVSRRRDALPSILDISLADVNRPTASLFGGPKPIVATIDLPPLPGAANYDGTPVSQLAGEALADARVLVAAGVDAILVHNSNDHPPGRLVPKTTVAAYASVARAITDEVGIPVGIGVLKSDPAATLGIAAAVGARFVRLNGYVGAELGAEGLVEGCAREAIQLRRELRVERSVEIWADAIQPTSRPLGAVAVTDLVSWCADFGEADRILVTGDTLDESLRIIAESRRRVSVPLILGGGVAPEAAAAALEGADGIIVGRYLRGGSLQAPIDAARVATFMRAAGRSAEMPAARA